MTIASWFSLQHSRRRLTQKGARRNRARAFNRRASFETLEDRFLLSSVGFSSAGESRNESSGGFSIAVTLSGPPSTPTISHFASGLGAPAGIAFDDSGNLYVADGGNRTLEKVTPAGVVSTLATEFGTSDGDFSPVDVAFHAGKLYVADDTANMVDEVTATGDVRTFVAINSPHALAFDPAGNLYVAGGFGHNVSKLTPAGVISVFASGFTDPRALAFDAAGNLYVADIVGVGNDSDAGTVDKVTPAGAVSTFASGFNFPHGLAFDAAGNLYVANTGDFSLSKVTPAGAVSTFLASGFGGPWGLAFDAAGTLYVANAGGRAVSKVSQTVAVPFTLGGSAASGVAYSGVTASPLTFGIGQTTQDITGTFLSDPGPTQTLTFTLGTPTGGASLGSPSVNTMTIAEPAVVQFRTGSETVNESAGTFSIPVTVLDTPNGTPTVSTFASGFDAPFGLAVDAAGNLYVANTGGTTVSEVSPAGAVSTFASGFHAPDGLAFDAAGNLYVADRAGNTVSEVTPAGVVRPFASGLDDPTALAVDSAGNVYVADASDGTVSEVTPAGVAHIITSGLSDPEGLAFDSAGDLYIADHGHGVVVEVSPAGLTTFSGFDGPFGLAVDPAGNLYVSNTGDGSVSEMTPAGAVTTFASGFLGALGLAVDAGNLYVTNESNNTMSEVTETLVVPFTLGGTAVSGVAYSGVTAGLLAFGIGQTTQDITGTLVSDPGPTQTLTLTLGTPAGGAVLGSPSESTLTITEPAEVATLTTTGPPVFIGEQRVFSGKGKHKKLVGFKFLFNGALNAGVARSTGDYHVTQKQGKKVKVLPVKSALYNPTNFSVTISVAGFKTGKAAHVTIAGLAGANGAAISPVVSGL